MPGRFLILDRLGHEPAQIATYLRLAKLALRGATGDFFILADPDIDLVDLGGRGAIVGRLFHRHGPSRPIACLEEKEMGAILASDGKELCASYWGTWVACIRYPDGLRLLRDPSGGLPCYVRRQPDGRIAASSRAGLLAMTGGSRPAIDWTALAEHLRGAAMPARPTALKDMDELRPGFVRLPDGSERSLWSPHDHLGPVAMSETDTESLLARRLRAGMSGLSHDRGRILVSLSGGLDSSIIAAGLVEAGRDIVCLNMFTADARGDERSYARTLCAHIGAPLIERPYLVSDVDLLAPLNAHLPRPMGRSQALAYERAHLAVAREIGADSFATGNGGDNVLAHSQSAAAIADSWLARGLAGLWRSISDTCRQTGCSPFAAMRSALGIVRRRHHAFPWRPDNMMLTRTAASSGGEPLRHPWLDDVRQALPGQKSHVAALLRVQQSLEPMRACVAPIIHPLLAQPVVEAALAIPSWQWRSGGIDRAAARRACAALLPSEIIERRGKGGPDGFSRALILANQALVRERLADGRLVAEQIVDRDFVLSVLAEEGRLPDSAHVRLQELLVAEAWIDHWSGVEAGCGT